MPCDAVLKRKKKKNGHHWLPQFAIKNGYFMGVGADVPELAELTVLEAMLLSSCGPTYSAIRTFYVKDLPNAAEAGELFGRGMLIGHHCVKQFAPADIAAFVTSIDAAGTSHYDPNKVPLPLNVHVVMPHGELRNQEAVLDAVAKCKRVVTCRPRQFATAVAWLQTHNPKCEQHASPVLPELFENLPAGAFTVSVAAASASNITSADPAAAAQTVYDQSNTQARSSILVAVDAEAVKRTGGATVTTSLGQELVMSAHSIYPSWLPENLVHMYPTLYPFGRGGPTEKRQESRPVSMAAYVAHCLQLSHRGFSTHPDFLLERYSRARLDQIHSIHYNRLRSNPTLSSAAEQVTVDEFEAAAHYQDRCKLAREQNGAVPPKPVTVTDAATSLLLSAQVPLNFCHGTDVQALRERNMLFALQRHYGGFQHWNTTTPDDLASFYHAARANVPSDASAADMARQIAADPAACAQAHLDIVAILIEEFLGWDMKLGKQRPGGGLFGRVHCFGGVDEEQFRGSLHLHILSCIFGLPRTPDHWREWAGSSAFRNLILRFAERTMHAGYPISAETITARAAATEHADATMTDVVCERMRGINLAPGQTAYDFNAPPSAPASAAPTPAPPRAMLPASPPPVPAPFHLARLPRSATHPTKPRSGILHPHNLECTACGATQCSYGHAMAWALEHATAEVVASYKSGPKGFHGIEIDVAAAFIPDAAVPAAVHNANAAAMCLLVSQYVDHDPGHKRSCFKGLKTAAAKTSAKSLGCRFRLPEEVRGSAFAIIVNGDVRLEFGDPRDADDLPTIDVVDLQVGMHAHFPYTPRHSAFQLALFRCNVNTAIVNGLSGACYYLTCYASKLPSCTDTGRKMALAFVRSVEQLKGKVDAAGEPLSPLQHALRTYDRLTFAATASLQVGATTAALYLLRHGETGWHSHKFAVCNARLHIAFATCTDSQVPAKFVPSQSKWIKDPKPFDYACRPACLVDVSLYFFCAMWRKDKHVMRERKPDSFKRLPFKPEHPESETHSLLRWPTDRIPLMNGRRLPPQSCLGPDGDLAKAEEYYATALTWYMPWSLPDRPLFTCKPTLAELKTRFDTWVQPSHAVVMLAHEEAFYQGRIMAQRLRSVRAEQEAGGARACSSDSEDSEADGVAVGDAPALHTVAKVHSLPQNVVLALDVISVVAHRSPQPTEAVPLPPAVQSAFDAVQRLAPTSDGARMDQWRAGAGSTLPPSAAGSAGCVGPTAAAAAKLLLVGPEILWLAAGQHHAGVSYGAKDVPAPMNVSLSSLAAAFRLDKDPRQLFVFQIAACQLLSAYLRSSGAGGSEQTAIALAQSELAKCVAAAGGEARRVVYLGGAGGCGKSNVVQAIRCFAQAWGIEFMVHTVAYTGMAAVNIGGCTMHHHVRLPGRFGYRSLNLPRQAADFAATHPYNAMAVLVIDEVSMVSAGMLGMYERAVTACCGGGGAALFGGRVVLLAGDLLQMQPVGQTARIYDHHLLHDSSAELPALVLHGLTVWRGIDTAVTLETNYRARCPLFRAFLDRFRRNEINAADRDLLEKRCRIRLAAQPGVGPVRLPPPQCTAVMHDNASCGLLAAALAPVDAHSLRRHCVVVRPRYYAATDPHTAQPGAVHSGVFFCDPVSGPPDNANRPFAKAALFLGQQHCLQLSNAQQNVGLCNGVKGFLVGSHPDIFGIGAATDAPMPEILFFCVPKFVSAYADLPPGVLPLFPTSLPNQRVPGVAGVCKVEYFPCRSMEASTLHKIQGLTLPAVSIPSVRSGGSNTNSAYVGMSRVGSFDDLFIFPGARLTDAALFGRANADGEETPVQTELRRLDSHPLNPFPTAAGQLPPPTTP